MHRIPATLRSYDIATIYVMQDKIQNDMMYGDKASKAILSNLSYQFFGKDKKVKFKLQNIQRQLPEETEQYSKADLEANFERIYEEARSIFD
jgi:type IV secretory pathway TraG/TraD family ATPase VirD4